MLENVSNTKLKILFITLKYGYKNNLINKLWVTFC